MRDTEGFIMVLFFIFVAVIGVSVAAIARVTESPKYHVTCTDTNGVVILDTKYVVEIGDLNKKQLWSKERSTSYRLAGSDNWTNANGLCVLEELPK